VTATPPPALDAFACYRSTPSKGSPRLPDGVDRPTVSVRDGNGTTALVVERTDLFCAPTDVAGDDPSAPTHAAHATAYRVRATSRLPRDVVRVVDRFNPAGLNLARKKRPWLLAPTVLGTTPPVAFDADHFACDWVARAPGAARFASVPQVSVRDRFGALVVRVSSPRALCRPVDPNGEAAGAEQHPGHLVCYQAKLTGAKFTKRSGVAIANRFGAAQLDVRRPAMLCVPAAIQP
jgi:hypothetical protein